MTWTLRHNERPWTANSARAAQHWSQNSTRTKKWRNAYTVLAREAAIPALGPCRITVTPYLKDRRGQQDVGACAPAAKAAIDGIRDAGVWPDDNAAYVVELVFRAPIYGQGDALEVTITPVLTQATEIPGFTIR